MIKSTVSLRLILIASSVLLIPSLVHFIFFSVSSLSFYYTHSLTIRLLPLSLPPSPFISLVSAPKP